VVVGRRILLAVTALAGFALAVVPALGDGKSIETGPGNVFTPDSVTVNVGDSVTIANSSMGFHNVHWDDRASAEEPVSFAPWSTSRQFDTAGTYRFYCEQHGGPGGAGMSAVVTVVAPDSGGGTTTTSTQPTTTSTNPPPADTTPTTTSTTPTTSTAPPPSQNAAAADSRVPSLRARAGSLRRRIQLVLSVTERARIVAVIRGNGVRTTVRFVLVRGNRVRTLLRNARPGRYTVTLTATDEAGNRTRAIRKIVRVRAR
jgi:plastocyanin